MKAILISIKPKWVAAILNDEKTIEIRKTMPECDLPIDVYIYCTKDNKHKLEYCDIDKGYWSANDGGDYYNSKVVAKFTLNKVEKITIGEDRRGALFSDCHYGYHTKSLKPNSLKWRSCLDTMELINYLGRKTGYAWYIDNLVIFDKPKELSEFYKFGANEFRKDVIRMNGLKIGTEQTDYYYKLTKAPQSWCYVEESK